MTSVKSGLFYNLINNVSRVLFPIITAPYITRVLSPENLGLYNFSSTYAHYFAVVAALGIPYYGSREIAKIRDNHTETNTVFTELLSISIFNTLVLSIIYIISILFFEKFSKDTLLFLIVGVFVYCTPFNIDWFYSGLEKFKYITTRSIIIKIVGLFLLFSLVRDKNDLLIYAIIVAFSTIASDLWNFVLLVKMGYKASFNLKGIRKHIKPLLVLFASVAAISIYTMLDSIMLGFFSQYDQVAYYTYPMHISKIILAAITSLSAVVLPRISYYLGKGLNSRIESMLNKSLLFVSFLSFPVCLGIFVSSPVIVPLYLGNSFMGSIVPLQILSILIIIIGFNNLFSIQCLVSHGYDKLFFKIVICGAVVNFILNLILIPEWGAIGASVSSVISELFVLSSSFYYAKKKIHFTIKSNKEYYVSIITSISFIPLFYLIWNFISGWSLIICFCALSTIIYIAVHYYTNSQILLLLLQTAKSKINIL